MSLVPFAGLSLLALAAVLFAAWPVLKAWRDGAKASRKALLLLAGAIALFVLGIGGGIYGMVGQPHLALREAQGLNSREINGLALPLIRRVRANPDDQTAWMYLAQIYMGARDAGDAAAALGNAVAAARRHGRETPALDVAYGEMLVQAEGQVGPRAQSVFSAVLAADPRNIPARYYLGMGAAEAGDKARAGALWQGLLAEVPPASPLHQRLVDLMASLGTVPPGVAGAGGAPDIGAMVAGLAARLKANPADPAGWQRLIRAYAVLGDTDKARQALASARISPGADKAALAAEAHELKLE